ncbi:hypothetical protein TBR22_A03380 [Luteitalea sp. TBR-22]|uniref:hypothetical protein n=1 Tax=Luteitalea sp. TBR-22 TaxID=2802971 RepID=UPI001AFC4E8F|nr:hypothetical protein [Luteitalea sp. TBR-22]BCS31138.1 hypothetical protein TBR22_A03380 [Luteitalea sp. TBR-22]
MTEPNLNPELFQAPPQIDTLQKVGFGVGLLGIVALAVGFAGNPEQFYKSYLLAYVFVLGIPIGSLALLMVHHLSGGRWSLALRRTFEASARTIPLMAVLFLPVILGIHHLYEWSHLDVVANDPILRHKAPYLNQSGFIVRAVAYFAIWSGLALMLARWSAQQDTQSFPLDRFNKIAGPGVLILGLTVTFASVDWVMSLDPHWFSTLFGLWFLVGMALTALAFSIVVASLIHNNVHVAKALSTDRFHDYGTLLYAFIMLWAYLSYSQFLIIWSANLPEEIPYYLRRFGNGWQGITLVIVAGHFVLPWLLLLFRSTKRMRGRLVAVASFMLVMRFLDVFWLIAPWVKQGAFGVHWMDIAATLGVLGLWVGAFCYLLKGRALLPVGDPYLPEALADGH